MNISIADVLITTGIIVGAFFFLIILLKRFMYICRPNEILIFSGRSREGVGYRVVFGGRAYKTPLIERVSQMDMTLMPVDVVVQNAYSKGGIPTTVHAIANIKLSGDRKMINNAIERFLGRDRGEIRQVARDTLEGNLRNVVATMTPEEVNEDRLKFAEQLAEEVDEDLSKLGLSLDTLKIQNVSDDSNYLNSIGRRRIAEVIRDAEIAESNAKREAAQEASKAKERGDVSQEQARAVIAQKRNELNRIKAELEAKARSEEEMAHGAAREARAKAEQELQQVRSALERVRLEAEVVIPAETQKRAEQLIAKGKAAYIEENGKAMAEVMGLLSEAWIAAGKNAKDIFLIQQLETVIGTVVESVQNLKIGEVSIVDSGDGKAMSQYVASFPAAVAAVLKEVKSSTGIDIPSILLDGQSGGRL